MRGFSRLNHVVYEITNKCNLFCRNCYVSSGKEFPNPPFELVLRILNRLKQLDTAEVLLCGGEPTVRRDLIEIFQHSRSIDLPVSLSTNGLVNSHVAEHAARYCREVDVSLRGPNSEEFENVSRIKGSYKAMRAGLLSLSRAGANLNINYDLTTSNCRSLYSAISELIHEGVTIHKIWVQRTSARGRAASEMLEEIGMLTLEDYIVVLEQMTELERDYKIKSRFIDPLPLCLISEEYHTSIIDSRYGIDWAAVSPNGVLRRDPVDPASIVGSIFYPEILDTWVNDFELNRYRSLEWLPSACQECNLLQKCKGGFSTSLPLAPTETISYKPDLLMEKYKDRIIPFR